MSKLILEQCKTVKRWCWEMYSHRPWFFGCVYKTDESGQVIGLEMRKDPAYKDRFTYVSQKDGVPISVVPHDLEKHGEPYKREVQQ